MRNESASISAFKVLFFETTRMLNTAHEWLGVGIFVFF